MDGNTHLAKGQAAVDGRGQWLLWRTPKAATFYLQVRNAIPLDTCDQATYQVGVQALLEKQFLPLVLQQNAAVHRGWRQTWGETAFSQADGHEKRRSLGLMKSFSSTLIGPVRSVVVRASDGQLYLGTDDSLNIINPNDGALLARIPLAGPVQDMALHPDGQRLAVTTGGEHGQVLLLDAEAGTQIASTSLDHPSGVAFLDDDLYVAETEADRLAVLDASSGVLLQRVVVGRAPLAIVTDSLRRHLYVGLAGDGEVWAFRPESSRLWLLWQRKLDGLGLPQGMVVDPGSGYVYVTYRLAPRYGQIAVLDASGVDVRTLTATLTRPMSGISSLALDASQGRLYASTAQGVEMFRTSDGAYLKRIGGTQPVVPAGPFALAVDALRGRLYVGSVAAQFQPVEVYSVAD
ncbi:MAG TPA: hypothetical protein EYP04_09050 [Anaerolineae bacterium]|nr:hypothetical protein [Anaerolineae bacterium]HIQ06424.1 hypothetical protein [Anaerolineae bacterium]